MRKIIRAFFIFVFSFGFNWPIGDFTLTHNSMIIDTATGSHGMKLTAAKLAASQYAEYGASAQAETAYTLTVTIYPEDASNQEVDWQVEFVNAASEWASGKAVTDYVTVRPTADGALTAVLENIKAFGEQIIITVTSRDNPDAYATCVLDYLQRETNYILVLDGKTYTSGSTYNTVSPTYEAMKSRKASLITRSNAVYTKINPMVNTVKAGYFTIRPTDAFKTALEAAGLPATALKEYSGMPGAVLANYFDSVWGTAIYGNDNDKKNLLVDVVDEFNAAGYKVNLYTEEGGTQIAEFGIYLKSDLLIGDLSAEGQYSITYKVAGSEEILTDNYSWLLDSEGNYPVIYDPDEGATVNNLRGVESAVWEIGEEVYGYIPIQDPNNSERAVYFSGWYLDSECTQPFNGNIPAGTTGNIELYAKINEHRASDWTGWY